MLLLFCNFTTVAIEDVVLVPEIVKVSRAISLKPQIQLFYIAMHAECTPAWPNHASFHEPKH